MKFGASLCVLLALSVAIFLLVSRTPSTTPIVVPPATPKADLPTLPAHFVTVGGSAQPGKSTSSNHFREYKDGNFPKLTREQVEPYLQANHHSAESLIAAFMATGDRAFVHDAMEKFPNDPKVAYAALYFGNLSPQESRQWLDNFKRVAPDNSMANYSSALDYMKSGQSDLALQDMAAAGKGTWTDYSWEFMQSYEEAYRSAGYSALDAKYVAQTQMLLPDLAQLKQLGVQMNDLAQSYQQAGNAAAAQNALRADIQLGQQLSTVEAQPLITTLVGIAVQKIAFSSMDPSASFGDSGQTVQDEIDQLTQRRQNIRTTTSQYDNLMNEMSDDDIYNYLQRRQISGEISALQWANAKYAPQ